VETCVEIVLFILAIRQEQRYSFNRGLDCERIEDSLGVLRLGYFIFNDLFVSLNTQKNIRKWQKNKRLTLENPNSRRH
jgi:hypothetical protein